MFKRRILSKDQDSDFEEFLDVIDNPWGNFLKEWVMFGFPLLLSMLVLFHGVVFDVIVSPPVDVESVDHLDDVDPFGISFRDSMDDCFISDTEFFILE